MLDLILKLLFNQTLKKYLQNSKRLKLNLSTHFST